MTRWMGLWSFEGDVLSHIVKLGWCVLLYYGKRRAMSCPRPHFNFCELRWCQVLDMSYLVDYFDLNWIENEMVINLRQKGHGEIFQNFERVFFIFYQLLQVINLIVGIQLKRPLTINYWPTCRGPGTVRSVIFPYPQCGVKRGAWTVA